MNSVIKDNALMNSYLVKLQTLLDELNNADPESMGDVFEKYRELLTTLDIQGLAPMVKETALRRGDYVNTRPFNELFDQLKLDITALYSELVSLNQVLSMGFNQIVTEQAATIKKVKKVRSLLADLKLFTSNFHDPHSYLTESFVNTDNVDLNSDYVFNNQATIDQTEGISTLGFAEKGITDYKILAIKIEGGNGQPGNNWVNGALRNGNPDLVLDNNSDTWFEYEMVEDEESDRPLFLSLVAKLDKPQILNKILLQPNNFGGNWPKINAVETSIDGKVYTSVLDNSMLANFVVDNDVQKVFNLGPTGSKYEGMLSATFFPRTAQYVRIRIQQDTPYPIVDYNGKEKLRYAIGLRGMWAMGIQYYEKSEVVSKPITFTDQAINKLALSANHITLVPPLLSIIYEVSPDDGATWHEILPIDDPHFPNVEDTKLVGNSAFVGANTQPVNKVLSFNTGDENSIVTSEEVKIIRWRIRFERNTSAINSSQNLYTTKLGRGYIKMSALTATIPNPVSPENMLLHGTILSQREGAIEIGALQGNEWNAFTCWQFEILQSILTPKEFQTFLETVDVKVNGVSWWRAPDNRFIDNYTDNYRITDKGYMFGDGSYQSGAYIYNGLAWNHEVGGKQPVLGAKISIAYNEAMPMSLISRNPLRFKLQFPTDSDKASTIIFPGGGESGMMKFSGGMSVPIPVGVRDKKVKASDFTGLPGTNLPNGWIIGARGKTPAVESTYGAFTTLAPGVSGMVDKNKKYTFIRRSYIDGETEFKLEDHSQTEHPLVNIHDHPSSYDQFLNGSRDPKTTIPELAITAYIPPSTEPDLFLHPVTQTIWKGRTNTQKVEDDGENATLMMNLRMQQDGGVPANNWVVNSFAYVWDKPVIFYSAKLDDMSDEAIFYFSKKIPADASPILMALDYFIPMLSHNMFEYSKDPEDLGRVIEVNDKVYQPTVYYFDPADPDSGIEWILVGSKYITTQISLGTWFERGSLTWPTSFQKYFIKEVPYINGNDEFLIVNVSMAGLYSIDYDTGTIYFPHSDPVDQADLAPAGHPDPFSYKSFSLSAFCNIGFTLAPGSTISAKYIGGMSVSSQGDQSWKVEFTPKISSFTNIPLSISWDQVQRDPNPIAALAPYFSPIVREIELSTKAVYKDDLPLLQLPPVPPCTYPLPEGTVVFTSIDEEGKLTISGANLGSVQSLTYDHVTYTPSSPGWSVTGEGTSLVIPLTTQEYISTATFTDKCGNSGSIPVVRPVPPPPPPPCDPPTIATVEYSTGPNRIVFTGTYLDNVLGIVYNGYSYDSDDWVVSEGNTILTLNIDSGCAISGTYTTICVTSGSFTVECSVPPGWVEDFEDDGSLEDGWVEDFEGWDWAV